MLISKTVWYEVIHLETYWNQRQVLGVFRQSLVSMLVSSCDHKEKQVVDNIFEVIKVHIILSFEAILFKQWKGIAIFIL